jgi:acetyltransferase-like isoleucine patch superfamily enzyme
LAISTRVYTSPLCQLIAVNHIFDDPAVPFVEQGITAQGIVIEDDVWIGPRAVILDGVRVGKGAVVTKEVPAARFFSFCLQGNCELLPCEAAINMA